MDTKELQAAWNGAQEKTQLPAELVDGHIRNLETVSEEKKNFIPNVVHICALATLCDKGQEFQDALKRTILDLQAIGKEVKVVSSSYRETASVLFRTGLYSSNDRDDGIAPLPVADFDELLRQGGRENKTFELLIGHTSKADLARFHLTHWTIEDLMQVSSEQTLEL